MTRYVLGLLLLALAAFFAIGAFGVLVASLPNVTIAPGVILLVIAAALASTAFGLWIAAVRDTPGDELLSGRRGLLVSLMLVGFVSVATFTMLLALHQSTWRGFIEGWNR